MFIVETMITKKDFQTKILPHISQIPSEARGRKFKISHYKMWWCIRDKTF